VSISPEYRKIVINALCSTLRDDANPQIRAKAAESLGKIGYEEAIPALCNAWLQDEDINVRFKAVDALVIIINSKSIKTMSETPKYDLRGANIGNLADSVQGNQIANQSINVSGQQQSLAEAAKEIQDLLAQLQSSYPTTSDYEKQVFVNKFNNEVKTNTRVRDIILAGGIELIKILCPPLGIPIEMGKRWLETAERNK
jgi:2C-methyl-D-erythritol 2,4-cyclodiphosphate synthase